eukprot:m.296351 g.296351  ORF g.296351 m.296351 type:complete len:137 (+) comp27192_c0_seq3:1781-2191(+)
MSSAQASGVIPQHATSSFTKTTMLQLVGSSSAGACAVHPHQHTHTHRTHELAPSFLPIPTTSTYGCVRSSNGVMQPQRCHHPATTIMVPSESSPKSRGVVAQDMLSVRHVQPCAEAVRLLRLSRHAASVPQMPPRI